MGTKIGVFGKLSPVVEFKNNLIAMHNKKYNNNKKNLLRFSF